MSKKTKKISKEGLKQIPDYYTDLRFYMAIIGGVTPEGLFSDTVAIEGSREEIALAIAYNMVADETFCNVIKKAVQISINHNEEIMRFISKTATKIVEYPKK